MNKNDIILNNSYPTTPDLNSNTGQINSAIINNLTQSKANLLTVSNIINTISGNENLEYHVYQSNILATSIYNGFDWNLDNTKKTKQTTLNTNSQRHLNELGFSQGQFDITYNVYKKLLGSLTETTLIVDEISQTKEEIRLKLFDVSVENLNQLNKIGNLPKQDINGNIINIQLNFGTNNIFTAVNWRMDPNIENSIVFKLIKPIPDTVFVEVNNLALVCVPVIDPINVTVNLFTSEPGQEAVLLRNPNWTSQFNIKSKKETDFYNWDTLLSTNSTSSYQLINKHLSGSLSGIDLNIDHSSYSNFVFYSSAEQRLKNFYYKLGLVENYNGVLSTLHTQYSTSFGIDQVTVNNNIVKYNNRLNNLFGTFDNYEKYLYYESGSSVDIESSTWPKSNTTYPYTLYSINTNTAQDWYESQLYTASLYDENNVNKLTNTIPYHISSDESNIGYVTFVEMLGQHFDILWSYVNHMTSIYNRKESIYEGLSKDLIYHVLQSFGWEPEFGNQFEDLWLSSFGGNKYSSSLYIQAEEEQSYPTPYEDISKQVWKRILNNLPYLLKNKGTAEGIRALICCYGIPDTILRVKEYGGPDKYTVKSKYKYNKFYYAWNPTGSSDSNFLTVSGSTYPNGLEFRFKTNENFNGNFIELSRREQVLFTNLSGSLAQSLGRITYINNQFGNFEFLIKDTILPTYHIHQIQNIPILDGAWWSVLLNISNEYSCSMFVKKTENDNESITHAYSSSFILTDSETGSLDYCYINFPGNVSSSIQPATYVFNQFNGELQELRFWSSSLNELSFNNHVLSPISYNSNTITSSYNDLLFHLPLGNDVNLKYDLITLYTNSVDVSYYTSSSHPNQNINLYSVIAQPLTMSFVQHTEHFSTEWPDVSANRIISNKIRIEENNAFSGNTLDLKRRSEISANDLYPTDTTKIGVYLSPTNEINEDIANQFGGFRIDDYIGDEEDYYTDEYVDLIALRNEYFKKYNGRFKIADYVKLLKYYDSSLFNQIKKMVPARSRLLTGLVIEPSILERPKIKTISKPTYEVLEKYVTLNVTSSNQLTGTINNLTSSFSTNIYQLSSDYNELISNPIVHTASLSGDTLNLETTLDFTDMYLMNSSSVLNTVITSSVQSSRKQIKTLYISNTGWLEGYTAYSIPFVNDLLVGPNAYAEKPWLNPKYACVDDTNYSQIDTSPSKYVTTASYETSELLNVGGYGISNQINFQDVHSVRGIKLNIKKRSADIDVNRHTTDYIVKLNPNGFVDESFINKQTGINRADISTYWKDDAIPTSSYYGSPEDNWGYPSMWNKLNVRTFFVGVSSLNYYYNVFDNLRPQVNCILADIYFNKIQYKTAEIQDFEPTDWANLKYNGCKLESAGFNQLASDGLPVVDFWIVNSNETTVESAIKV
jgi:hypothetical protein